jgi:hypothetical protein
MGHAWISSFGVVALDYGHQDLFRNKFNFWFTQIQTSMFTIPLFWIWAYAVLVGIATWANRLRCAEKLSAPAAGNALALVSGVHILGVMCIFSININEDSRFLVPLVPGASILLMWAIGQIQGRATGLVLILAALLQWGYVHSRTLDLYPWSQPYSWLEPVERSSTRAQEVAALVHIVTENAPFKAHIVGVEFSWCNPNSLSFYSAKEMLITGKRVYFTELGYGVTEIDKALARLKDMKMEYYVSVAEEGPPPFVNNVNQVALPMLQTIQQDTAHYRQIEFPSTTHLLLFQRTVPWTEENRGP